MQYQIRVLDKTYSSQVNELRKKAYFDAKGVEVHDDGIFWNKSDDQSIVLGIFNEKRLISTMRAEIISDINLVEQKLECPWNFGAIPFPVIVLSKAAIDLNYTGLGFNSILRLMFFSIAKDWGIKTILGTMTANSLRIASMEKLGYKFFSNDLGWHSTNYKSLEKVVISKLDFEQYGSRALEILTQKYAGMIKNNFEVDLDCISYEEVTVVC